MSTTAKTNDVECAYRGVKSYLASFDSLTSLWHPNVSLLEIVCRVS